MNSFGSVAARRFEAFASTKKAIQRLASLQESELLSSNLLFFRLAVAFLPRGRFHSLVQQPLQFAVSVA